MAEEKQEKASPEPAGRPSRLPLVLIPAAVFVVSLALSSWWLGFWSRSTPASAPAERSAVAARDAEPPNPMARDLPAEGGADAALNPDLQAGPPIDEAAETLLIKGERDRLQRERADLEVKKRELQLLKQDIEKLLARVQDAKSERIALMAKLYDSMESEAVAKQIASMDDRTVVALLPQMNTRTAAKIMALLEPKRAAQITTKLLALEQ